MYFPFDEVLLRSLLELEVLGMKLMLGMKLIGPPPRPAVAWFAARE